MNLKRRTPAGQDGGTSTPNESKPHPIASRQVSWWTVHEFVAAVLNQVNDWPTLGTPAWCSMAHDDPAKWAALLDAARHHALRLETCQQAQCDASREISAAADWPAVAREVQQRNAFYAERPWLKRVAS
jgi:Protein of unknown function (DUF2742)